MSPASGTLADEVMAACAQPVKRLDGLGDPKAARKLGADLSARLRRARRYVIDDEVVRAATELGVEHPDVVLAMLQRARTPFPSIWLEWNLSPHIEQLGRRTDDSSPERLGCLVECMDSEAGIYRSFGLQLRGQLGQQLLVGATNYVWRLDLPLEPQQRPSGADLIAEYGGLPPDVLAMAPIGEAFTRWVASGLAPEEQIFRHGICRRLASHVAIGLNEVHVEVADAIREAALRVVARSGRFSKESMQDLLRNHLTESFGDWRLVICMLVLLNSPDLVAPSSTSRAGASRSVGAKTVPYLDFQRTVLRLSRPATREHILRAIGPSMPRRRHAVSGHWRQSRRQGNPTCQHVYADESPSRSVCLLCGHKRWWVNDFVRGDASIGFVSKDITVKMD